MVWNERGSDWTTLKYVDHVLSAKRVNWLKRITIEEEHEPVVIDLASDTDYSSDTDTARLRACEIKLYLKVNKLRNKIHTMMKKIFHKKRHTHTHRGARTHAHFKSKKKA